MAFGTPFVLTAELDQGPATYQDTYNSSLTTQPLPYGARNPLGSRFCYMDAKNRLIIVAYVRLNCTAVPASFIVGPVYWKDNTFTVVTAVESEGLGGLNSVAGILLNTSMTNGNYCWIIVSGYCGGSSDTNWGAVLPCNNATVIGDGAIGATGNQAVGRAAAGSPTYKQLYRALTNNNNNYCDGLVTCEFQGTN